MSAELDLAPFKFAYNIVATQDDKHRVLLGAFPHLVGEIERLRTENARLRAVRIDGAESTAVPLLSDEAAAEVQRQLAGLDRCRSESEVESHREIVGRLAGSEAP